MGGGVQQSNSTAQGMADELRATEGKSKAHRLKPVLLVPSIPIDLLFDNHAVELEECRRWANSDAGQIARVENPAGFANVRAHAEAHLRAIGLAYVAQGSAAAPARK
jgi:hypothetical protein